MGETIKYNPDTTRKDWRALTGTFGIPKEYGGTETAEAVGSKIKRTERLNLIAEAVREGADLRSRRISVAITRRATPPEAGSQPAR